MVWFKPVLDGAALFERGVAYEDFVANYDEQRRQRFDGAYEGASFDEADLEWFRRRAAAEGGRIRTLVVNENWCGDGIMNLAVLGRLNAETGAFDIRVLYRDAEENADDVERYFLTYGRKKIPVFVFLDAEGREIGRFASRSEEQEHARIRGDQDGLLEPYRSGTYVRDVVRELKAALA